MKWTIQAPEQLSDHVSQCQLEIVNTGETKAFIVEYFAQTYLLLV